MHFDTCINLIRVLDLNTRLNRRLYPQGTVQIHIIFQANPQEIPPGTRTPTLAVLEGEEEGEGANSLITGAPSREAEAGLVLLSHPIP